jgi:hypothetical protein
MVFTCAVSFLIISRNACLRFDRKRIALLIGEIDRHVLAGGEFLQALFAPEAAVLSRPSSSASGMSFRPNCSPTGHP